MTAAEVSPTPYQLLPRLTDEEYEALKADIAENGIRVPIDVDENGVVLDGHHRAWIAADLDVACPQRVVSGLDEIGKRNYARAVNALRRHLTRDARREQVAQMREEGQSIRMIAGTLGVPKSTVALDLSQVSSSGHLDEPEAEPEPSDEPDGFAEKIAAELTAADPDFADRAQAVVDTGTGVITEPGDKSLTEAECEALDAANGPEPEPEPEAKVTGLDGKQHPKTKQPARSRQRPLIDEFRPAISELDSKVKRITKLAEDARFNSNAGQISQKFLSDLTRARDALQCVIDQLP